MKNIFSLNSAKTCVFILFFLSGFTALMYEVILFRMFDLIFGISTIATCLVVSAFMGGLSIGSLVFGKLSAKISKHILMYAYLELLIGFFTISLPLIIRYFLMYSPNWLPAYFFSSNFYRFLVAFILLIVPTTCMGATFPLLIQTLAKHKIFRYRDKDIGILYSVNILGGVVGVLVVSFILLQYLGIAKSLLFGFIINIVICGVALIINSFIKTHDEIKENKLIYTENKRLLMNKYLMFAFFSGLISVGAEILWFRLLVGFIHSSVYSFSTILVIYLFMLSLGSFYSSMIIDKIKQPLYVMIGLINMLISAGIIVSLFFISNFPYISKIISLLLHIDSFFKAMVVIFYLTFLALFIPVFFMGMLFPLIIKSQTNELNIVGKRIGLLYFVNLAGCILGPIAVTFFLIPYIGIINSFTFFVILNLAIAFMSFYLSRPVSLKIKIGTAIFAIFIIGFAFLQAQANPLKNIFEREGGGIIYYKDGVSATVMVLEESKKPLTRHLVFGDGRGAAGTSTVRENRYYAHIPMLLHKKPEDILVICFGVGNTLSSFRVYDEARTIDCVELSPEVITAAKFFPTNNDVLRDPRIKLHFEDGRNYLLGHDKKYDIIQLEPPEIHTASVVNLYTKEFYDLCKKRLNKYGIICQWLNITMMDDLEQRMLMKTFLSSFNYVQVWQGPSNYSLILVGSQEDLKIDFNLFKERFYSEKIYRDLKEVSLDDLYYFLSLFLMDKPEAIVYCQNVPLVTDDKTFVDYSSTRYMGSCYGIPRVPALINQDRYFNNGYQRACKFFLNERRIIYLLLYNMGNDRMVILSNLKSAMLEKEREVRDLLHYLEKKYF